MMAILPQALAIYTRNKVRDYGWHICTPVSPLLKKLQEVHAEFLADRTFQGIPNFALLSPPNSEGVGLVIGHLRSRRRDHVNRPIYNSLAITCNQREAYSLYALAANLVRNSRILLPGLEDYAEQIAGDGGPTTIAQAPPLEIDVSAGGADESVGKILKAQWKYPRKGEKLADVYATLQYCAKHPESVTGIAVVSTDYAAEDSWQQLAAQYATVIGICDDVKEPIELKKRGIGVPRLAVVGTAVAGLLAILVLSPLLMGPRKITDRESGKGSGAASVRFRESACAAATLVGMGAVSDQSSFVGLAGFCAVLEEQLRRSERE